MKRLMGALTAVLVLAGCTASAPPNPVPTTSAPTPTPTRTVTFAPLVVGDCVGGLDPGTTAGELEPLDCTTSHSWEVFSLVPLEQEALPDTAALATLAEEECLPAFSTYIGVAPGYSRYDAVFISPDATSWEDPAQRAITCLAGSATSEFTGSAKGDSALFPEKGECTGPQDVAVLEVTTISCKQPHHYEVYAEKKLPGKKAPTTKELDTLIANVCVKGFTSFVGTTPAKSKYDYTYYAPDADTWDKIKDHRLVCSVGSAKGGIEGSLKGAKK